MAAGSHFPSTGAGRLPAIAAGVTRGLAVSRLRILFADAGLDDAALDARLLVGAALDLDGTALLTAPDVPVDAAGAERIRAFAQRRLEREPVARITGHAEFWGLGFRLSTDTLVPRPDTETLIDTVLAATSDRSRRLRILDLGTGSGCLVVALLHELPNAFAIGIDRSEGALGIARSNACANGVGSRAAFLLSDWGTALAGPFDVIVSNPPYIASGVIGRLEREVSAHEPPRALDGGRDGLDSLRAVLADVQRMLTGDGLGVVEIGHDQADAASELAADSGLRVERLVRDLGGHQRAVAVRRRS